ncbi:hypothetical protein EV421DRAFT_1735855 [Armillaria borealis]|uniref:Uncharacterized protein n=1 Tax=Armillaria borealis TaxID=47425 RepID=A0AA39MR72_9AGAR|nr:hypothetical protein EV421DRAFT_1735855 [Armillaria borealis]
MHIVLKVTGDPYPSAVPVTFTAVPVYGYGGHPYWQLIQSLSVSSTNFLRCIKLPALREVILTVVYDKDADQQVVDLPNDVIIALSELIRYSHCSLIRLSINDTTVVNDDLVEVLRLTPCLEECVIQFNRWDEDNDPGMELLVDELGEVELVDGSFRYSLIPSLRSLGVVLEGVSDTHISFLDRSFLEMVSSRHRKGLLMKLHLHVTGHNWSYDLDSDDEVDLEELRDTGLALDFVLDNIK